ncbi:MAG: IS21 family transposase [Actinomycetota bacterium]
MVRSRVELFEAIRRDARREELSIRGLSERYGVHRRTVRAALGAAEPPPRKVPARAAPRLDPVRGLIDGMLREDLDAPRKQRHTARRVLARLVEEHHIEGITYSTVRDYVHVRRPQIWAEAGRTVQEAFVPQTHDPGAEAEVDFADLWIILDGVKTKVFLFTLRLSHSGRAVHRVFASQSQEAFLEGHVHAFTALGGVPTVHIRYDNLKSAVSRVLFGRSRIESGRWVTFRSHYGFDAFYCAPGVEGAHEKGGVEGEGGRFRRTHLVPMPVVASISELNAALAGYDAKDDHRRIGNRTTTVGAHFAAAEQAVLRPLPAEPFETGLTLTPRVDRYARISVRQVHYSVPARLIGARVRVLLRAGEVLVYDGNRLVAAHERSTVRGAQVLNLDHYLEVLTRKPGALPGSTALVQARASGAFTPTHEAYWAAARKARGDRDATRALIEVLLLHRHLPADAVITGMKAALSLGTANPEVVAVEARRATRTTDPAGAHVIPLPTRPADPGRPGVLEDLPGAHRPLPNVAAYDELLSRRTHSHPPLDVPAPAAAPPPHPVTVATGPTAGQDGQTVS